MPKQILVTGGAGVLGRHLVSQLSNVGYIARVMSRRARSANVASNIEWAQADLATGQGLAEAVAGVQIIIHAATSPLRSQPVDVDGTRRLIEAARSAHIDHLVYISIVGIDRVPLGYYRAKLAAENMITASHLSWSILRATQFHDLLDAFIQPIAWFPLGFLPTHFQFQPIDSGEVAEELVRCVAAGPSGRLPDMGGPEIHRMGELAHTWLNARRMRRPIIPWPLPGKVGHAFRNGYHTCPDNRQGKITWAEWLHKRYGVNESLRAANTRIATDERGKT